ncbi:MAG: hypothetical protein KF753_19530 [Caldilineaceae bacterium]|nr:hypothetical protein [Caldilineaceae bacterium]
MTHLFLSLRAVVARGWRFNRMLTLAVLLHLALIPVALVLIFLHPTVITGSNAWIKPTKFAISVPIYLVTFGWFLAHVKRNARWIGFAATGAGIALLVETTLITVQAVRGVPSHFNNTTAFDAAVFSVMGGFIIFLTLLNLLLAIWLIFQKLPDRAFAWALRWGAIIAFAGMGVGSLMPPPTPAQLAALEAGEVVTTIGAHSVGVEDGGPGLSFLGWSTEGGDLRAGHFLGLHGMQILPLAAWILSRRRLRGLLRESHRVALVHLTGVGYVGLTGLLTWQALRGQSIVAPDGLTWAAYAGLLGVMLVGLSAIWLSATGIRTARSAESTAV